ncbi:glycosyltransferase family 4 protein [Peijinzhouia sedimentorum]
MKRKLQVILCTDGIFPHSVGGMQRHSRLLAESLAQRNNVELFVIHPHNETVFNGFDAITEIQIKPIDPEKFYLKQCYEYSRRVAHEIDKIDNQAIIYSQGLSVWFNIRKFSHRLILNPHGLESFQVEGFKENIMGFVFREVFKYLFNRSRHVVSLGGKLSHILKKNIKKSESVVVLPNGVIPKEKVLPKANSKIQVLFVSRFAYNKGIGTLFEAVELLNRRSILVDFEFHLVGKGPLFDHYSTGNPWPNVICHGFLSDEELNQAYADCDIFLLPTWFEGMPTVVLEAMSFSKPIIVSDVGATAELVDSNNGYLLEARDAQLVADALIDFKNLSDESKKQLGENSYNRVIENFTWDKVAERHEELFEELGREIEAE